MWAARAVRALVLSRSAYREVAADPYMTGPAIAIALVASWLQSFVANQDPKEALIGTAVRLLGWLLAVLIVFGAGRLLGGRGAIRPHCGLWGLPRPCSCWRCSPSFRPCHPWPGPAPPYSALSPTGWPASRRKAARLARTLVARGTAGGDGLGHRRPGQPDRRRRVYDRISVEPGRPAGAWPAVTKRVPACCRRPGRDDRLSYILSGKLRI